MNTKEMVSLLAEIFGDTEIDIEWWRDHLRVSASHRNVTIEINHINWQDWKDIEQALAEDDPNVSIEP